MDHLNANMEGEIVEGEIVEGEIAEAMEGEIAEAGGCDRRGRGGGRGKPTTRPRGALCCKEWPRRLSSWMEDVDKEENHPQILFDHVNEEAVGELATREVSKVFRSGPTLLRAAGDLLVQCGRNRLPCGARAYKTVYFEESLMVALKKKGRRHTVGGADGDQLKALRLKNPGVASGHMAASTFMLPRWLRDVARAGLRNHYTFDLENCHPTLIAARHDSAFLKNFVAERNAILAKTHHCGEGAVPEAPLRWQHRELGDGARDDDLSDDGLRARVSEDGESSGCRGLLEEPRRTEAAEKRDCPTPRAPLLRFEHRTGEGAH